jgi:peptidoglycan hydrolase-like protein with peptidoglycan-binding domain
LWSVIVAGGVVASALPIVAPAAPAVAADNTPWTAPVRPALCTDAQAATGNVAGCLLDGADGLPEARGWPAPPFPDASGATPFVTVGPGATGEIVRRIQNALTLKGVATPVDGNYGAMTQASVQTFQQKSGLGVTGVVDSATAIALGIYSPGGGQPVPWTPLQRGSTGEAVRAVQVALNNNGANLVTDGNFGALTEAAVKTYQSNKGLSVTGIVDAVMADMLGVRAYSGGFPAGWSWSGWGFNSSYALLNWESALVSNQVKIGPVSKGGIKSVNGAQQLLEGFVRDIVAGGYQIKDLGGYVFRCTSNSRKDCQGLTRSSLSNHSWGMAVDINVGANPELRYANCQVPLTTDFPQWVVQAAEKWGLYWGGYGWGRGCASSTDTSTGIIRDVMHFEFRGTPAQAAAILAFNGGLPVNLPPANPQTPAPACSNYVDAAGVVTGVCLDGSRPGSGSRLVVATGAPADASAALVNITVDDPGAAGYVTAETCDAVPAGDRASSNGNYAAGQTVANVSVVPVDDRGWFCVYTSAAAHVVVDVQGYLTPAGGSLLNVIEPRRVTDTRNGPACAADGSCTPLGPIAAGALQQVIVDGIDQATAVLANLTVTDPAAAGYLTADACGSLTAGEQTRSNANFTAGQTVANLSIVPTSAATGGQALCIYANQRLHDIVDIQGYFTPAAAGGLGLTSQTAERLIDTRQTQRPAAGSITKLQAPAGVSAALVNITLTGSASAGYVTADRCSALSAGEQTKSNGNFAAGRTVANLSVVPVDADGSFCIYNSAAVNLIVDIQGTLGAGTGAQFQPVTPIRKLDTRQH